MRREPQTRGHSEGGPADRPAPAARGPAAAHGRHRVPASSSQSPLRARRPDPAAAAASSPTQEGRSATGSPGGEPSSSEGGIDDPTRSREDVIQQDVADLHKLGYAQELFRSMGGFSNFAISFSIISILTGAVILYDYGLAWAGTAAVHDRLAARHGLRPAHRGLDGGDRLGLPDGRRPLLLGQPDEEQELGLVDRLAQPDRPVRDRRRHQLRGGRASSTRRSSRRS